MSLKFDESPKPSWSAQTFEIRIRPKQAEEQAQQQEQFEQNIQQQAQSNVNDPFEVLGDVEFETEAEDEGIPVPEMVFVEGGEFMMGSEEIEKSRPVRKVKVDGFEIGKYPVTQREWEAVMGNNPSRFKGDNRPVEKVSWDDCQEYIKKLNEMTGSNFRLPTEAEWEYAAGGGAGNRTRWAGTDDKKEMKEYVWFNKNSKKQTWPVGMKKPNQLGMHDMSGNVWEWCEDWYGTYDEKDIQNPKGPKNGEYKVVRGGSWHGNDNDSHMANRGYGRPNTLHSNFGFRLCRYS